MKPSDPAGSIRPFPLRLSSPRTLALRIDRRRTAGAAAACQRPRLSNCRPISICRPPAPLAGGLSLKQPRRAAGDRRRERERGSARSCLQVLLAAARTWKAEGDVLTLQNPSARFLEDLNLLGLEPGTFLNGVIAP